MAGVRIARMQMQDRGPGPGGTKGLIRNLICRDRKIRRH